MIQGRLDTDEMDSLRKRMIMSGGETEIGQG